MFASLPMLQLLDLQPSPGFLAARAVLATASKEASKSKNNSMCHHLASLSGRQKHEVKGSEPSAYLENLFLWQVRKEIQKTSTDIRERAEH